MTTLFAFTNDLKKLKEVFGTDLEELKGRRKGQRSVRVNDQFRICFVWKDGHVHNVEIADYH